MNGQLTTMQMICKSKYCVEDKYELSASIFQHKLKCYFCPGIPCKLVIWLLFATQFDEMVTIENLIGEDDSCDVDDGGDGGDDDGGDGCDGDDGGDGYVMVVFVVMFVKLNCLRRQMSVCVMAATQIPCNL